MSLIINAMELCEHSIATQIVSVEEIKKKINKQPEFVIINASNDEANSRYIKGKVQAGEKVGLKVSVIKFEEDCTNEDILNIIHKCNKENIPMILQLPTFKHLNTNLLLDEIEPHIDADCFGSKWLGEIAKGNDKYLAPATPKGVINLLEFHDVEISGKVALVIGKSNHVGKPLCSMLINRGATLISANSKTKNLAELVRLADIVISCVGKTNLIEAKDIKDKAVVIGVGFSYISRKQILDFDVDEIVKNNKASLVSSRINCTGKATIDALIDNVIELYKINYRV